MKKIHFEVHTDGFYGDYWKCKTDSDCAMIPRIIWPVHLYNGYIK